MRARLSTVPKVVKLNYSEPRIGHTLTHKNVQYAVVQHCSAISATAELLLYIVHQTTATAF